MRTDRGSMTTLHLSRINIRICTVNARPYAVMIPSGYKLALTHRQLAGLLREAAFLRAHE